MTRRSACVPCRSPSNGFAHLDFVDLAVILAGHEQLLVRPLPDDAPAVEYEDVVGVQDGADALGDDYGRRIVQIPAQRAAQRPVGLVVERGGAVVEYENLRLARKRPGDEQALLLPAGEVGPLGGEHVREAALLLLHKIRLGELCRDQELLVRDAAAEVNVGADAVAGDEVVLKYHAEHRIQFLRRDAFDPTAVDADLARIRVVEAQQQADDRGLAAAGRADHAQGLPAPERKAHVRQVVARLAAGLVVRERDVPELHMIGALFRQRVARQRVCGRLQDFLDAFGAGHAFGIDHKQARHHEQRVEDDRKVAQKRDDLARLRNAAVDTVGAYDDHGRQAEVEQQTHHRVRRGHDGAGALVAPHDLAVNLVKAPRFILRARERLDDAHAGHVFLHLAHQRVHPLLHVHVERHALAGDAEYDGAEQRQRTGERERENRFERERHADAAQQQDRPAHAEALHAVDHLVDVVGVGREARDQRRKREAVHLTAGEIGDPRECIVPELFGKAAGDARGHAVGDHVAQKRDRRRNEHENAPEIHPRHIPQRHDIVEDIGKHPRQQQLRDRSDEFDKQLQDKARILRPQIAKYSPHRSPVNPSSSRRCGRAPALPPAREARRTAHVLRR